MAVNDSSTSDWPRAGEIGVVIRWTAAGCRPGVAVGQGATSRERGASNILLAREKPANIY